MAATRLDRRALLCVAAGAGLGVAGSAWSSSASAPSRFAALERSLQGRLGVQAIDTANGATLGYRAGERFPFCSTFKLMLAAAILQKSRAESDLLQHRILFDRSDFVSYSPVTEKHIEDGMTVAALCAAAVRYSDNTAANLLMRKLGGPTEVTAFARSIGDTRFRLDRWETALNSAIPGDLRDTTTPQAMALSVQRLVLGDALGAPQRDILQDWLRGNTTGAKRIRAAAPAAWQVGDKTGTGDYGSANDVAVLWPPQRAPVVIVVYTTRHRPRAEPRDDVIAAAARVVVDWLG